MSSVNLEKVWTEYAEIYDFFYAESLKKIHKEVALHMSENVIDVGCGVAKLFPHLDNSTKYFGIDSNPAMIQCAQKKYGNNPRFNVEITDAQNLKTQNSNYDSASLINVIYSLPSIESAIGVLKDINTLLKRGAPLLFTNLNKGLDPKALEKIIVEECVSQITDKRGEQMFERFVALNQVLSEQRSKDYKPLLFTNDEINNMLQSTGYQKMVIVDSVNDIGNLFLALKK